MAAGLPVSLEEARLEMQGEAGSGGLRESGLSVPRRCLPRCRRCRRRECGQ